MLTDGRLGFVLRLSPSTSRNAGASLVSVLWQGIQSLAGWLWNRVSNWVYSIWNGILGFFGIHSPSKQMAWVGDMLVAGLAGAITSRGHKAVDAAANMAKDTMDAMGELTNGVTYLSRSGRICLCQAPISPWPQLSKHRKLKRKLKLPALMFKG